MASVPGSSATYSASGQANNTVPLVIITILFFMWGLLTSLNDVLIPHLKSVYTLSYTQAMLVQFCFFGAYFIVSLPAGYLVKKIGYQNSAVAGLVIASAGCALFYPASTSGYALFLFALFVLASGITILQVAANPYVTVLGPAKTASSRLNLTQAFNSLGTTIAPWLGGILILGGAVLTADQLALLSPTEVAEYKTKEASSVQGPYLALAGALFALAIFFAFCKLPKIKHDDTPDLTGDIASNKESALSHTHLVLGAIGIFLYVGAEVAIGSLLINFFGEKHIAGLQEAEAAHLVSYYWGGAMIGRFIGFAVMRYVSPGLTLAFNCTCAILLVLTATFTEGKLAMWAIIAVGLFNSIMFPTIFSLALHNLGKYTGQGSGVLCMAIVGGALIPLLQGALADTIGLQLSFLLPAVCYVYILYFGVKYANLHKVPTSEPGHL
ncbi:L-fucose:H+ symporter permease [Cellvibrio japonicus]|uniref:Glucose/galactose transporter n=1 Tax=Cellvibrio japonicus (strain Ueda107) TaxID=498211 RepID=B3PDN4_CELJU|nr:L-fucose:H+ symporter permease [Cellvibrio japonicus]ACE86357.1 Glucose/galactose transporter [Cellvibrio japonicus Ueda107]QEI12043.1 L-fucose:H+ symporter permease [Cellvibrio japonicus]QEI15618.1 L-fucose:H+ symporter permease [Cellvibrio japonicus]QEI19196.1 L-fucose:H+ symporter permease [Cellvibrio japonicus]